MAAENQLMFGLKRRYAQTLGRIEARDWPAIVDLDALAAVILMFRPDTDLGAIKPIRPYRPKRSKWLAAALALLRETGQPMTAREIARRLLAAKGLPVTDKRIKSVECSLHFVLERLEGRGVVREPGQPKRWKAPPL
jgi:hypothetical protein